MNMAYLFTHEDKQERERLAAIEAGLDLSNHSTRNERSMNVVASQRPGGGGAPAQTTPLPAFSSMLAAAFVISMGLVGHAETPDSAQWIWGTRDSGRFEHEQGFILPSSPEAARLRCAVDFCTATLWLNDRVACIFYGSTNLRTMDVRHLLRGGDNRIHLTAERTDGPAALAYELSIALEDGRRQFVRSSSEAEEAGALDASRSRTYGAVADEPWWNIERLPTVSAFAEYNQWEEAISASAEEEAATFQIAAGFEIELVYSAKPEDGSWVSMAIDQQDRILLGKEASGILRLNLPQDGRGEPVLETLNDTLQGVQGLLPTPDGLFASANRSHGLFRLNRNDRDEPFSRITLLRETVGSKGDHGRHDVVQDSQGRIYVIHGDSVQIPDAFTSLVPATNEFENKKPEDGHVIQTDLEGTTWNVFCAGLRNAYGLAFNRADEMFTYDADAERHTGLPWYRPTRIVHLMPGVDYGWRSPGIPWPGYLPDTVPPIAKIGRGSPTALKFGYASSFPTAYRQALFALDWSFGRILAVHLIPWGSTYGAHAEVLVRGRPFNVCDLAFADGSMYVITGGRDTQSRLYRIRYVGTHRQHHDSQQVLDRNMYSATMRERRRALERLYDRKEPSAAGKAWSNLAHPDLGIRSAARILLEHQPISGWEERLWNEKKPEIGVQALLAMVRIGQPQAFLKIHEKLHSLSFGVFELPSAIRIESLIDQKLPPDEERSPTIRERFEAYFPTGRREIDRELCRLLVDHQSEVVVERTLDLLSNETDQLDKFHYLVCLADATAGWSPGKHDAFFRLLSGAQWFITDEGLDDRLQRMVEQALKQVTPSQQSQYRDLFTANFVDQDAPIEASSLIHQWTVPEIVRKLEDVGSGNPEQGEEVFEAARCSRCHRFGTKGRSLGPDLSTVAFRFSRRHIVEQIVDPSKTISSQHRNYTIALANGKVIHGQVVYNGFRKSILRIATDPMALHRTTEIHKDQIESFQESDVSPMPERLLDNLSIQQIADLLAFLESGTR